MKEVVISLEKDVEGSEEVIESFLEEKVGMLKFVRFFNFILLLVIFWKI